MYQHCYSAHYQIDELRRDLSHMFSRELFIAARRHTHYIIASIIIQQSQFVPLRMTRQHYASLRIPRSPAAVIMSRVHAASQPYRTPIINHRKQRLIGKIHIHGYCTAKRPKNITLLARRAYHYLRESFKPILKIKPGRYY